MLTHTDVIKKKYGTLTFIIAYLKHTVGLISFEDIKVGCSRIADAESGPLSSVFFIIRVFNGHLSFAFNFTFQ